MRGDLLLRCEGNRHDYSPPQELATRYANKPCTARDLSTCRDGCALASRCPAPYNASYDARYGVTHGPPSRVRRS